MRAQQMTIAKLLGGFEISKCRAEAHAAKLFGTLSGQRRESMDATIQDTAFYNERCVQSPVSFLGVQCNPYQHCFAYSIPLHIHLVHHVIWPIAWDRQIGSMSLCPFYRHAMRMGC